MREHIGVVDLVFNTVLGIPVVEGHPIVELQSYLNSHSLVI